MNGPWYRQIKKRETNLNGLKNKISVLSSNYMSYSLDVISLGCETCLNTLEKQKQIQSSK